LSTDKTRRHALSLLFLDGVYVGTADSSARFRRVKAPGSAELTQLAHTIAHRLARYLERQGLRKGYFCLTRDGNPGHLCNPQFTTVKAAQLRFPVSRI